MKNWILIIVAGLLLCFFSRFRREKHGRAFGGFYTLPVQNLFAAAGKWLAEKFGTRDDRLARLEEVLRTAELTNNSFFRSLEMVQKNLESVILRAENAEQRLHSLLTQTDLGKADQYSSAALLLSEGKGPEQVARMLSLPLHQVQLVQKLRQAVKRDGKPISPKAQTAGRADKKLEPRPAFVPGKKRPAFPGPIARGENGAARREKDAVLHR